MKLINSEKQYLKTKIKECEILIKYSNSLKINELSLRIEDYKYQLEELKIENKQINYGK
jgi:hypothetical protein